MASEFANPLLLIWESYEVTAGSLSVALRTIEKGRVELWDKTTYWDEEKGRAGLPKNEAIAASQRNFDELIIVALWATFERFLIEYVQNTTSSVATNRPKAFAAALKKQTDNEIERWRIDDILGLYNSFINAKLLGQVKQIKQSRDWIVHRNPRHAPSGKVVGSDYAFRIL